jgi:N-acetylmuramoyl-L-alanine amidase
MGIIRNTSLALTLSLCLVTAAQAQERQRTVLIDVGHSAADPGATGASGRTEFSRNQALARDVADAMRARGWRVVMPNADGRVRTLAERPRSADAAGADLLIAIHHDSVLPWQMPRRADYRGFSVWASGSHPAARASFGCARSIGAAMRGSGMVPNLSHAMPAPGAARDLIDGGIGFYRRDGLAVLRLSRTPAVLVEAGVIVNPAEEAWLGRPETRRGIAGAIAYGADGCIPGK